MDTGAGDNGNGRVTLAVIGQKLDEILRRMDAYERRQQEHEIRLNALEQGGARREERLNGIDNRVSEVCGDVQRLESKDTIGSLMAAGMAVISGIIGWFR